MKKKMLFIMLLSVLLLCAGCGKGNGGISGTYKGTGHSEEYIFVFSDDGTCSMDRIIYSKWLEGGSETESLTGIWRENASDDSYEIILNGWSGTLYAEVLESGELLIRSDESWWDNLTVSKEE